MPNPLAEALLHLKGARLWEGEARAGEEYAAKRAGKRLALGAGRRVRGELGAGLTMGSLHNPWRGVERGEDWAFPLQRHARGGTFMPPRDSYHGVIQDVTAREGDFGARRNPRGVVRKTRRNIGGVDRRPLIADDFTPFKTRRPARSAVRRADQSAAARATWDQPELFGPSTWGTKGRTMPRSPENRAELNRARGARMHNAVEDAKRRENEKHWAAMYGPPKKPSYTQPHLPGMGPEKIGGAGTEAQTRWQKMMAAKKGKYVAGALVGMAGYGAYRNRHGRAVDPAGAGRPTGPYVY